MSYNWDEEVKVNNAPQICCRSCGRTEQHGALFNYHTEGVGSPYGYDIKLGQHCTECMDKLRKQVEVPYYLLDTYLTAESSLEFYKRKAINIGVDTEALDESKVEILREYCKLVDAAMIELHQEKITKEDFMLKCIENTQQLTSWIAEACGVSRSAISQSSGIGFKKVDY